MATTRCTPVDSVALRPRSAFNLCAPEIETRCATNLRPQERPMTRAAPARNSTGAEYPGNSGAPPSVSAPSGAFSFAETLKCVVERAIRRDQARRWRLVARRDRASPGDRHGSLRSEAAGAAPGFDPYQVQRRFDVLAFTLDWKLTTGTYTPGRALDLMVAKSSGGQRRVCQLTLPDLAVSAWFRARMMAAHDHQFSASAFGHRVGGGAERAVRHVSQLLARNRRVYVVELDIENFFDSINVTYVLDVMRGCLGAAEPDLVLMEKLLRQPRSRNATEYREGKAYLPERGVPQGSPISMLAGNLACLELDRDVEALGVGFARYVDDIVVICDTFAQADTVMATIGRHCALAGLKVHPRKSPGISIFSTEPSPFRQVDSIDFVGRRISQIGIGLSARSVEQLKARLDRMVHRWLVSSVREVSGWPSGLCERHGAALVRALERVIYGGVRHAEVVGVLRGGPILTQPRRMSGYLLFPDASAGPQLRELDGWLVDVVLSAWKKRVALAAERGVSLGPLTKKDLIAGKSGPLRIPSVFCGWRYLQVWNARFPKQRLVAPAYGREDVGDDADDLDDASLSAEDIEALTDVGVSADALLAGTSGSDQAVNPCAVSRDP